jgi:hypothetical protein
MTKAAVLSAADTNSLASTIAAVVNTPGVELLVNKYLVGPPRETFAGTMFDSLGPSAGDEFTVSDVAAVSLLDVRFSPKEMFDILNDDHLRHQLKDVTPDVDLWDPAAPLVALRSLYGALKAIPGVGRTKASKLLARKRPSLAPISDSVVDAVLDTAGWTHLETLATVLRERADLRAKLSDLAAGQVTPLRALDIAVWMLGSRSTAARLARSQVAKVEPQMRLDALIHPNRKGGV